MGAVMAVVGSASEESVSDGLKRSDLLVFPPATAVPSQESLRAIVSTLSESVSSDAASQLRSLALQSLPLHNKKVLVTGSARTTYPTDAKGRTLFGIGDAVAEGMILNGATVALNSFSVSMCQERLAALRERLFPDQRCEYIRGDMSTWHGAKELVANAFAEFGVLDVLVLNAGTFIEDDFLALSEVQFDRTMSLNHKGPIAAIQEYAKLLGPDKPGRVVITTSINARLGEPAHVVYDASKAALEASMRSIILSLSKAGYNNFVVNAVAPGLFYTPLTHGPITADAAEWKRLDDAIPMHIGWPEELVQHYVHLASDSCKQMNGAVLDVSGGLAIRQAT